MSSKKFRRRSMTDAQQRQKEKRKDAQFSRQVLAQRGFVETRPGVFEKPQASVPLPDPGPPTDRVERRAPQGAKKKARPKGRGEDINPSGFRFQLVVISYRPRPIDPSNTCVKWIEDFLVERGLMPDDSVWFCNQPVVLQVIVPETEQRTEVFLFRTDTNPLPYIP